MSITPYNYDNPQKTPTTGSGFVNIKPYQYSPLPPINSTKTKQPLLGKGGTIKTAIDKTIKGGLNSLYDITGGLVLPGSKPEDLRNPQLLKDTAEAIVPETLRTIGNVVSHPIKSAQSAVGGAARGISDTVTGIITNLFVPKSEQAATSAEVKNILDKYLGATPDNNISQGFQIGGNAAPSILAGGALGELGGGFGSELLGKIGAPTGTLGEVSANLAKAKLGQTLGAGLGGASGFVGVGQASIPTDSTLKDRAEQATKDLVALGLFHIGSKAFDFAKSRIFDGLKTQSTSETPPPPPDDGTKISVESESKPQNIPISTPETRENDVPITPSEKAVSPDTTPEFMKGNGQIKTFSDAFPKPVNVKPFNYSTIDSKSEDSSTKSEVAPKKTVSQETTDKSSSNSKSETTKPVDISPDQKTSGVAKNIESKAIEQKLTTGFKKAKFKSSSFDKEDVKTADLINSGIDNARAVVRGEKSSDIKAGALIAGMEKYAKENPSEAADIMQELANSHLTTTISEGASETSFARMIEKEGATAKLQKVKRSMEAKIDNFPKKKSGAIKDLKDSTNRVNLPADDLKWDKFLDTIKC